MEENMHKRKVLFVIESLHSDKAAKTLSTVVEYIDKSKYDVTVCSINRGGPFESKIRENVKYKYLIRGSVNSTKSKWIYRKLPMSWVYRLYIPKGYDVEIACGEGFVTKLMSCSTNKKAKKYAWVHTDLNKNHWTTEVYKNPEDEVKAYNTYDGIICATNLLKEAFKAQFPDVVKPVRMIYSPLDSLSVRLKSLNATKEDPNKVAVRLVTQGRLEADNAYGRLLKVVYKLNNEGYDVGLWIFGDGLEMGILEHYIKDKGMENKVKLFGAHPNPYRYIVHGQLYVCCSYSSAAVKALILGMPIVATKTPENNELFKNGECALMVSNSENGLYDGIKQFLDNPQLLDEYRTKSEMRGYEFDIEALMAPIESLITNGVSPEE